MKSYSDIKFENKTITVSYAKEYQKLIPIIKLKVTGHTPTGVPIYKIPEYIKAGTIDLIFGGYGWVWATAQTTSTTTSTSSTTTSSSTSTTQSTSTSSTTTSSSTSTSTTTLAPGTGKNIEVPIEMVDDGLSSNTSVLIFSRVNTKLDPVNYDGATEEYYFEIVAENTDSSAKDVDLWDADVGSAKVTISVPTSASTPTRIRSAAFTPTTVNTNYRIRLEATTSANQLKVYTARIIVKQVDAGATRIAFPLVSGSYSSTSNSDTSDGSAALSYLSSTYTSVEEESLWKRDNSLFSAIQSYTFEVILSRGGAGTTAFATLWNETDDLQVTASEVSTTSNIPVYFSVQLGGSETNFIDLKEYAIRGKGSGATDIYDIFKANLYIRITSLTKAEVYYRFVRYRANIVVSLTVEYQRVLVDTSLFSGTVSVFHESTGLEDSLGDIIQQVFDDTTNDSGTGGSLVSGSDINFDSTTKSRVRTSAITITDGDRFIERIERSTGTLSLTHALLVVQMDATVGTTTSTTTTVSTSTSSTTTSSSTSTTQSTSTSSTTTSSSTSTTQSTSTSSTTTSSSTSTTQSTSTSSTTTSSSTSTTVSTSTSSTTTSSSTSTTQSTSTSTSSTTTSSSTSTTQSTSTSSTTTSSSTSTTQSTSTSTTQSITTSTSSTTTSSSTSTTQSTSTTTTLPRAILRTFKTKIYNDRAWIADP